MSNLSSNVMRKDFDGAGWARKNQDDFSKLIADAKRKKHNPSLEGDQPKSVDVDNTIPGETLQNVYENDAEASTTNGHPEAETGSKQAIHDYALNGYPVDLVHASITQEPSEKESSFVPGPIPMNGITATSSTYHEASTSSIREADHPGLFEQSLSQRNSGSEATVKKVPMFAVPQEYVTDVDGGSGDAVGQPN